VQSIPSAPAGAPAHPAETDYDRLFRLSLDLICVAGLDGYFKRVNPSWTRVLGWSEEELRSRPIHEFMHPDDRERTLQARATLAAGKPLRDFENRYRCKDGSYRWLSWQSVTEPGAPLVFAVARDVTERREMDHERLVVSKLESTGILAGGIAHDFNNLLASLLLNVEMVGLCGPMTPKQAQFLEQARQTVLTAKTLTQQLLTVAGPDASSRRTQPIGELVRQAADLALRDSAVQGECRIAPDLAPVRVSETQLTQVLRGLILNAREATPPGGRVRIAAENTGPANPSPAELPPGDYVRVTIADSGAGIPPEVLPRIFDPYFSTKTRGAQKGMGLGLTICRALIKRHGGIVTVDSQPGLGTTVSSYLPATMRGLAP
jgi:two-component system, cell cycle sensor histidine kinase and response regulator CckA